MDADGQAYTPTGLGNHVFTAVTDRRADGTQGTRWWIVDGGHVPDGVDPEEWAQLADRSLVELVQDAAGTRRDWADLHALLEAIPSGRWTTYGDLAKAIGSHAVPIGTHLASCTTCTNPWRVLNAKGAVSAGFRWPDPTRKDTAQDLLAAEGIAITNGAVDPAKRLTPAELQEFLAQLDSE